MNKLADLRSDTVTRPTASMREAMMKAPVGDDVFQEDPTVNRLQEQAAALLGKEAALFVPSGTMANQIAIKLLTSLGDEVLLEEGAHPLNYESCGASVLSSVQLRPLPGRRGLLQPEQISGAVRRGDVHWAPTTALCLENSHNRGGGSIYPLALVAAIRETAAAHGLKMHLDGARLFNACVASGTPAAEYARHFETVSFCLSKGLGAPVGSILAADLELIAHARRWRKMLGGGMRQAGILAAAGIHALDNHIERLAEDHEHAGILARGLAEIPGILLNPADVETNIVIFQVDRPGWTAKRLVEGLKAQGVLMLPVSESRIRAVTHLDINRQDIEKALTAVSGIMKA